MPRSTACPRDYLSAIRPSALAPSEPCSSSGPAAKPYSLITEVQTARHVHPQPHARQRCHYPARIALDHLPGFLAPARNPGLNSSSRTPIRDPDFFQPFPWPPTSCHLFSISAHPLYHFCLSLFFLCTFGFGSSHLPFFNSLRLFEVFSHLKTARKLLFSSINLAQFRAEGRS
jgi:hypothetical protein